MKPPMTSCTICNGYVAFSSKGQQSHLPKDIFVVQALLHYTFRVFCSYFNMFMAQFIYDSIQLLEITGFPACGFSVSFQIMPSILESL